jgi:hypothetical protein
MVKMSGDGFMTHNPEVPGFLTGSRATKAGS